MVIGYIILWKFFVFIVLAFIQIFIIIECARKKQAKISESNFLMRYRRTYIEKREREKDKIYIIHIIFRGKHLKFNEYSPIKIVFLKFSYFIFSLSLTPPLCQSLSLSLSLFLSLSLSLYLFISFSLSFIYQLCHIDDQTFFMHLNTKLCIFRLVGEACLQSEKKVPKLFTFLYLSEMKAYSAHP